MTIFEQICRDITPAGWVRLFDGPKKEVEVKVSVPNTNENRAFFKLCGLEERSGSTAYSRDYITILPLEGIYYQDNVSWNKPKSHG